MSLPSSLSSPAKTAPAVPPPVTTPALPFSTVLVANRGEIAIRLLRAVKTLHLRAVALYVADDTTSPHIAHADASYNLGASHAAYNDVATVLAAAKALKAGAVLPGYGFLSENADAAAAFERAGIIWLGPHASTIQLFGLKHTARDAAHRAGVPVVPGSPIVHTAADAAAAACAVGFPALLKASAGGGGMGQAIVHSEQDVASAFASVVNQAQSLFSSPEVYVERYVQAARHVEIQVLGAGDGRVVALGDRDCSVQRRRQKVLEEGNAPNLPHAVRDQLRKAAVRLCAAYKYRSVGTVEFVVDSVSNECFFLEVNTRLQVEHGVTEMVADYDLVRAMILIGAGHDVLAEIASPLSERGVTIQARVYAENPVKDFLPSPGTLSAMEWPTDTRYASSGPRIRVDAWAQRGTQVSPHYDPLLGKVLAWAPTRPLAILALRDALQNTVVRGVDCNIELLLQVLRNESFMSGRYTTRILRCITPATTAIEVVAPGLQSSLQDYPGRVGYWDVGVSPSGPMDSYAMGIANALVGNDVHACALEIAVNGPKLIFHSDTVVALTGAMFDAELDDGKPFPMWTPILISAGSVLTIGKTRARKASPGTNEPVGGKYAYLAVQRGFDVPKYLGSAATFPTANFGGLKGSFLTAGDFLPVRRNSSRLEQDDEKKGLAFRWPVNMPLDARFIPNYDHEEWTVGVLNGPHASLDFLRAQAIHDIWTSPYTVHHATNRLGCRLIGPVPKWTRPDGGSAGLHPSNLHDYTYAPGAVNFSGNTPIVLMRDGPSLGGFVCPITVASAELWKVAQANPGESIRFKQLDFDTATAAMFSMESAWQSVRDFDLRSLDELASKWTPWWVKHCESKEMPAVLASLDPFNDDRAEIKTLYRMSGDEHVLVEYGDIVLDIAYRMRVHMLMEKLKKRSFIKELCPGVRSLLVRYDRKQVHVNDLVRILIELESRILGSVEDVVVSSRVIELPLAFQDKWTAEAQARYMRSVRSDAPYMPSNAEFVRRINGLQSTKEVEEIITSAEYMVLGLGDVYLGAPCAVPVDPRHRLVTSKYNPARTYTPEGGVGIGGAYMCIYGMPSPGGYQLIGRTLPIWDNHGSIPPECRGAPRDKPWLLEFFDRVKYFPVSDDDLEEMWARFKHGDYTIKITEEQFSYSEYVKFITENIESIAEFESKREKAYAAERTRWEVDGERDSDAAAKHADVGKCDVENTGSAANASEYIQNSGNMLPVTAGVAASVWTVNVEEGAEVKKGDVLIALESMKVEISVGAPISGVVKKILVEKADSVSPDDQLCFIAPSADTSSIEKRIEELRNAYNLGITTPSQVASASIKEAKKIRSLFSSIRNEKEPHNHLESLKVAKAKKQYLPLYGVPFVVTEDVDSHMSAEFSSGKSGAVYNEIVTKLKNAGAMLIGGTSQFSANMSVSGALTEEGVLPCLHRNEDGGILGENGAASYVVSRNIASFAIAIDRNGSAMISSLIYGVVGLRVSQAFVETPLGEIDGLAIIANDAVDVERVLKVCVTGEAGAQVTVAKKSFDDLKVVACEKTVVKDLTNASEDALSHYSSAVEKLSQQGTDVQESSLPCIKGLVSLFEETRINWLLAVGATTATNEAIEKLLNTSVQVISHARRAMSKLMKEADRMLWQQGDVVVLPGLLASCTADGAKSQGIAIERKLRRLVQVCGSMNCCAAVVPAKDADANGAGLLAMAPAGAELDVLELLKRRF